MPSIKNILGSTAPVQQDVPEPVKEPEVTSTPQTAEEIKTAEPVSEPAPTETPVEKDFATCWTELFTNLFQNDLIIYHSLNEEIPKYENDIIQIEVKNTIQQEEFESRKKSILEYWRNHYALNVDDLEVIVNEQKETKKVIVNSQDKLENMMEQNGELKDFLNIINFRIKD